jgi:subtilisin family serine protease
MIRISIIVLLLLSSFFSFSQNSYWVFFNDKQGSVLDIESFHSSALERRNRIGVNGFDSTDFPVNQLYIDKVSARVRRVGNASRWLNAVVVEASKSQVKQLAKLPFIASIEPSQGYFFTNSYDETETDGNDFDLRVRQIARFNGDSFYLNGIDGKGIRIAVFDAGFPGVDTHSAFEHLRKENRIIATYDFTRKNEFVYRANSHGTKVLACIGGKYNDKPIGLATGAEYLLAITEVGREPFSEEINWLAALEWADRNGANIVNSSLGYTKHRYFPEQMDGKTSFVTRAANMAASKGILVINAAGNEGSGKWSIIGAPADADSIISVGGISPDTQLHISFASLGPTADGRLKPNVSTFGVALVANPKGGYSNASGTSFASPLVAGFAACAWQLNPNASALQMHGLIQQSADLYPYFDYAHGYGVPQADFFVDSTMQNKSTNQIAFERYSNGIQVIVNNFNPKFQAGYNTSHLFWHIRKPDGTLSEYGVVRVYQKKAFFLSTPLSLKENSTLWIHFMGEIASYPL